MDKENIILIGLIAIIVIGVGISFISSTSPIKLQTGSSRNNPNEGNVDTLKSIITGEARTDDVSVELVPHKVKDSKMIVDIFSNTHGIDLSKVDLKKAIVLKYDGKEVNPTEAPKFRGHHNSGELVFNVEKDPESFQIVIKGIPKQEERVYTW